MQANSGTEHDCISIYGAVHDSNAELNIITQLPQKFNWNSLLLVKSGRSQNRSNKFHNSTCTWNGAHRYFLQLNISARLWKTIAGDFALMQVRQWSSEKSVFQWHSENNLFMGEKNNKRRMLITVPCMIQIKVELIFNNRLLHIVYHDFNREKKQWNENNKLTNRAGDLSRLSFSSCNATYLLK